MDGVIGLLVAVFLIIVLAVAVVRLAVDLRRRDPDRKPTDTTVDMATGEVIGQGIAGAIIALLERLF
jgi:hypothetical protein